MVCKVTYGYTDRPRGKVGALNLQNSCQWHLSCMSHNVALNMFDKNQKLTKVQFYLDRDAAKDIVKKMTDLAYGFDATELQ